MNEDNKAENTVDSPTTNEANNSNVTAENTATTDNSSESNDTRVEPTVESTTTYKAKTESRFNTLREKYETASQKLARLEIENANYKKESDGHKTFREELYKINPQDSEAVNNLLNKNREHGNEAVLRDWLNQQLAERDAHSSKEKETQEKIRIELEEGQKHADEYVDNELQTLIKTKELDANERNKFLNHCIILDKKGELSYTRDGMINFKKALIEFNSNNQKQQTFEKEKQINNKKSETVTSGWISAKDFRAGKVY